MASELQKFFYKNNRLQQLRGFCYTAQLGSISRAAEHMGLTHSSVSLQIKALSDDMGVALLEHRGPKITITPEGMQLLKIAQPLIDGIHNLHHTFHESLSQQERSEIHGALNSTSINFIFPDIAKIFTDTYPNYRLVLHYAEQKDAVAKLLDDKVDFALLPRREHMPFPQECVYTPLFYYTPSLITLPDHPLAGRKHLSPQEIMQYELSLPARKLRVIPNLYDIFEDANHNFKLRVSFENWETTRRYIEEGLVISISSDVIIGKNDKLVATPLLHLFEMVDYGIIVRRGKQLPEKVQQLITTIKQVAAVASKSH